MSMLEVVYANRVNQGEAFFTQDTPFAQRLFAYSLSRIGPITTDRCAGYQMGLEEVADYLSDGNLTDAGRMLKEAILGKIFVDMGCGKPWTHFLARTTALTLGASEYWGIDKAFSPLWHFKRRNLTPEERSYMQFQSHRASYISGDMLDALSHLRKPRDPLVFLFSGIQQAPKHDRKERYLQMKYVEDLNKQLARLTSNPQDRIILGQATDGIFPEEFGFKLSMDLMETHSNHRVLQIWSKQKDIKPTNHLTFNAGWIRFAHSS